MKTKLNTLILALMLVSCSSTIKKNDISAEISIPENWSNALETTADSDSLWWNEFKDSQLNSIMEEAFRNNHTLKIASSNVGAAAAQARMAGAPLLPQANVTSTLQRSKQNFIGLPIPGREGSVLSSTSSSFGISLAMSWEIDLWGKLSADHANAIAFVQIAEADLYGAKLSLEAQVCKSWFTAIEAKRQVGLSLATLENLRLSTAQIRTRYDAGLRRSLDLRLALSNLAINEANLKQRQMFFENSIRQLEVLLGRYPSASLEIGEVLPEMDREVPAGLPSEIIARRPDLIKAERTLAAANAGIVSAKGALLPQINLTGSNGSTSREIGDLLNGDFGVWSFGANILQPIFQRGRLKAGVDLAQKNSDNSLNQYLRSVLVAFSEVETALSNEKFLQERESLIESATEQALAALSLAEDQYMRGLNDFITMLEAQRSAYENESQFLTVKRERLTARVDLYLALGGTIDFNLDTIKNSNEAEE